MGVENALKLQIVAAVELRYIEALWDNVTGRLNGSIYEIICHLFEVYGNVTLQTLFKQEQKVQQLVYDPMHPIDGVFVAIDKLVNFSKAAETPYSQPQCISLAYRILNHTGLFQRWIISWNNKPAVQKTWTNFKIYFRTAHQQLKETTNLQARDSSYHANAMKEVIQDQRSEWQTHQDTPRQTDQDSLPPITSLSENSNDSTISALQTEVASLKEIINSTM